MNKKVMMLVIIAVIAVLLIAVAYIFLNKSEVELEETGQLAGERLEVELNNPICNELVLNIEKVDCTAGELGINVSIFRRQDSLGEGSLIVNVTDKQGEERELKKLNFSSGDIKLSFYNSVAGEQVFITAKLELVKEEKIIICSGANLTYECKTEENFEEESLSSLVPNPTGSIRGIDIRDEFGEYYCINITNKTINPKHKIRIYAYQKINNTDVLSAEYLESEEISNVCSYYPGLDEVWYSLLWEWSRVENVTGYYVYQYYYDEYNNITIEYDYYTRVFGNNLLRDTGLELWNQVKN